MKFLYLIPPACGLLALFYIALMCWECLRVMNEPPRRTWKPKKGRAST